jgi:hypothetical protein
MAFQDTLEDPGPFGENALSSSFPSLSYPVPWLSLPRVLETTPPRLLPLPARKIPRTSPQTPYAALLVLAT